MALLPQFQDSFEAGAFPGLENVPANGAQDIVNGILEDDGSISRRGGGVYLGSLSTSPGDSFRNLWTGNLGAVGQVTVASKTESGTESVYAILPGASDFTSMFSTDTPQQRPVTSNGMLVLVAPDTTAPIGGVRVTVWGGATAPDLLNQNINLSLGSKTVIGTGTTFTSLTPGMLLFRNATTGDRILVVESVQSNTQLTLLEPSPMDNTFQVDFSKSVQVTVGDGVFPHSGQQAFMSSIFDRVVYAQGGKVTFTPGEDPFGVGNLNDYHELPDGAVVIGMQPLRSDLLVFTTQGVFSLSGMAFDLTDALGNVQQRLEQVAPDVVLWDNLGVASWRGAVVAPCVDDVYLLDSAASMRPITGGMRNLYRSYVNAGYQLGQAAVYQSHYVLPVINGDSWVDTLICDLRSGGWVRWDGFAGTLQALAVRVGDTERKPELYAASQRGRLLDLTGCFYPDSTNKTDPDGTEHSLRLETRAFQGGDWYRRRWRTDLFKHQWRKTRLRIEVSGATDPTTALTASYELGHAGAVPLSDLLTRAGDDGGVEDWVFTWVVDKRASRVRFVFESAESVSSLRIRELEVWARSTGRQ